MYHPWRALREMPRIDVAWIDLPIGLHAETDGQQIWIDRRLRQVERRCAIAHEVEHIQRGIPCRDDPADEAAVEKATARRLVDVRDLADALAWTTDHDELADCLWVTPAVLTVRLGNLHPAESRYLHTATAHHREDEHHAHTH